MKEVRAFFPHKEVERTAKLIGVGNSLAEELLILAGGDVDLVVRSSHLSDGLDKCKARIIDGRFTALERS